MNISSRDRLTVTDQLLMAGLVLAALESGRLPMNAGEYRAIASSASRELALMDSAALEQECLRLPPALHGVVENILQSRVAATVSIEAVKLLTARIGRQV